MSPRCGGYDLARPVTLSRCSKATTPSFPRGSSLARPWPAPATATLPGMIEALCAEHPGVASAGECNRCGRFCCAACLQPESLCAACFIRSETAPSSGMARLAFALGILGTVTVLPGVAALILGGVELRRIAEGRSPPSGLMLARGARLLGATALAIAAGGVLWIAGALLPE